MAPTAGPHPAARWLVCGVAGSPACGTADVLGAPGLTAAQMADGGRRPAWPSRSSGGGAVRGATVTLFENGATLASSLAQPSDGTDGGAFSIGVNLSRGTHTLTATQTGSGGVTSAPSAPLTVNVLESNAPAPPRVTAPPGNLVSGNGKVSVGGTASPSATVTVTAKPRDGGPVVTATFTANASGAWTGAVTLPPGSYDVTFTQTTGGATSGAGPPVNVEVAIRRADHLRPDRRRLFRRLHRHLPPSRSRSRGRAPARASGPSIVADGDGKFFVDIATLANNGGAFSGTVQLDYGRHLLKIFQRSGGLDGDGVVRTVFVRPPLGALAIKSFVTPAVTITVPSPPAMATVDAVVTVAGTGGLPLTGLPGTVIVYQGATRLAEGPLDTTGAFAVPVTLTGAGQQSLSVSQTARSLSSGGPAESARATISVLVRPAAPTIDKPQTGLVQPGSLVVAVAGQAAPGGTVTVLANGVAQPETAIASASGAYSMTLKSLSAGTTKLTAKATVQGVSGIESDPPVLISLGDVTPPTLTVSERPIVRAATDESGAVVNFAPLVTASDAGVPLPASAISCAPAQTPTPRFPIGSTNVTCIAQDAAGNQGATTFVVTVTSAAGPIVTGAGLTAEAQGPDGAVVSYQVSATGYTADCAPPESGETLACTGWKAVDRDLDFGYQLLAQNTRPGGDLGSLYQLLNDGRFFRLARGATQWEEMTRIPMLFGIGMNFMVGPGAPPVIYVPSDGDDLVSSKGLRISPDGGRSWLLAMAGIGVAGLASDPMDAAGLHFLAWRGEEHEPRATGVEVYETRDGWATWTRADQGLPPGPVHSIAMDPVNAGRAYAILQTTTENPIERIYRRIGGGAWTQLAVPPLPGARTGAAEIYVAPTASGCGQPQAFPTVFANGIVSRDGGETWTDLPVGNGTVRQFVFDRVDPCTVYVLGGTPLFKSPDGGRTWTQLYEDPFASVQLLQDAVDRLTLYGNDLYQGAVKSTDGGQTWGKLPPMPQVGNQAIGIGDVAVDPVDPNLVLVSIQRGMFRSTDGGDHWIVANDGVTPVSVGEARHIFIDRFQRNRVYAGYERETGSPFLSSWITSPNGGASWTGLVNGAGKPAAGALVLDPLASGHWFSVGVQDDGSGGTKLVLRDSAGLGGGSGETVVDALPAPGSGTLPSPSGSLGVMPYFMQMVPDAARTVVLSWDRDPSRGSPDVNLFSFLAARNATSSLLLEGGGVGRADVFFDGSDGTNRLFIDGGAIGQMPNRLYRTTVDAARRGAASAVAWEALGGTEFQTRFLRLVVDPGSGGQRMVAVDNMDFIWDSQDGGRTWARDLSAPQYATSVWLSPADGAVYSTVGVGQSYGNSSPRRFSPGLLWKRAPLTGVPVGARIALGDLRVTCTGPGAVDPATGLPLRAAVTGIDVPARQHDAELHGDRRVRQPRHRGADDHRPRHDAARARRSTRRPRRRRRPQAARPR